MRKQESAKKGRKSRRQRTAENYQNVKSGLEAENLRLQTEVSALKKKLEANVRNLQVFFQ